MSGTTFTSGGKAHLGTDAASSAEQLENSAANAAANSLDGAPLSVGGQLRAARLAKGLTANDVAKALKLSLRQVEALEADDWASLPCTTIIRGFIRNDARLLGIDSDPLMAALDRLTMPQGAELEISPGSPVSLPEEGKVDRRDFVRVFSGLIVLLLAVSAYFFLPQELWLSTVSAFKTATQSRPAGDAVAEKLPADKALAEKVPAEAEPAKAPEASGLLPPSTAAGSAATAPTVPTVPTSSDQPSAAPAVAAQGAVGVLKFSFTQPSWVEVRDRSGQVIFSKKNEAGSQREVEGQPPFAVVIGNSASVTLQYKGKVVELSKRSRDDVARLTLE
jgi:cytoskeleton protein RodZ